jgi:ATP-dependent Clp protease ATP-binding subunit ClpA
MFERFTREARAAVVHAQEIARSAGSRTIDTRHVLVSLVDEPGPVADAVTAAGAPDDFADGLRTELRAAGLDADALAALGIDLTAVRERAEEVFGEGALEDAGRSPSHIPFAADAKKALRLALREAIRLQQRTIDGRHLVLGMLRADCPARDALLAAGVDTVSLRTALESGGPASRSA